MAQVVVRSCACTACAWAACLGKRVLWLLGCAEELMQEMGENSMLQL
jgi:hypothetical protein